MSIINEALKRTERELSHAASTSGYRRRLFTKYSSKSMVRAVLVVLLIAIAIGAATKLFWVGAHKQVASTAALQQSTVTQPALKPVVQQSSAVAVTHQTSVSHAAASPYPNLAGIITMGDKQVAVFGHQSYHVGDQVNGDEILQIRSDKVLLSHKGRLVTLNVH